MYNESFIFSPIIYLSSMVLFLKIIALTDIHGRKSYIKYLVSNAQELKCDLVVIAGDLTYFSDYSEAISILKTLFNSFSCKVLFVPGNCDDSRLLDLDNIDNIIFNIHSRVYLYDNIYFYGIGGSNKTPFNTWIEWSEDDLKRFISRAESIDWNKLVLVTHTPIYSVMDYINTGNTGSKALYDFLINHGALLWITGHLHEYSGFVKVNKTIVLNPGPFIKGYYALIDISNGEINIDIRNFLNK